MGKQTSVTEHLLYAGQLCDCWLPLQCNMGFIQPHFTDGTMTQRGCVPQASSTVMAGLGFEPRSPKPLSFYHCLPLEGRQWNRCQRCSFPVKQTGKLLEATYAKVSKEGNRVRAGLGPQAACPCRPTQCGQLLSPGPGQAGCVLERHPGHCTSHNSLSGFTKLQPNSLVRAGTWGRVPGDGTGKQEIQDPFS